MIKINEKEIIFEKFPNNETLLKNQFVEFQQEERVDLFFKYESDSDLIKLMLVKKELNCEVDLEIMYMPYSRMDRGSKEICFTLKHVCEFVNSLKFRKVYIWESHSDKCLELINNSKPLFFTKNLLEENIDEINPDYILFPDKGAYNRYKDMFSEFDIPIIRAEKTRDFSTGKIENLEIIGNIKNNSTIVIVDDLSSYGGTFLWSASKLKEKGAGDIYLIVGHAENSILEGKIPESNLIKKVFTTNSIINKNMERDNLLIKEVI